MRTSHHGPQGPFIGACEVVNRAIDASAYSSVCYQWFKQRLILSVSEPSISQCSQIKEDAVEPSVTARDFNLKAYAAIT